MNSLMAEWPARNRRDRQNCPVGLRDRNINRFTR